MAVDVASMSAGELEAVWLRRAGMRSDLTVTIPGVTVSGVSFNVHKYPLYARTDFFQESSSEDPDSGRNVIDLSGLPGSERSFKQVASFCYGMDFKISPLDAPALACAAAFLGMTDDTRKGMGKYRVNLLSFTAAAIAGMLKHADSALAVLRGCAGLLTEADALGIVEEAANRLAEHAVTSHNLSTSAIHTGDAIALLPLDIFQRLLAKFKEKNLPEREIGSAIAYYAQHNLPDPKSLSSLSYSSDPPPSSSTTPSSSPSSSSSLPALSLSPAHNRRVLEGLTSALPAGAGSMPMQPLLGLLRCAIVLNASEGVKGTLQRRAGALFTDASLDDLLMLEISDVQGLLHGFTSEEHLGTLPDRSQALQAAASLIDSFLLHLSSPPTADPDAADGVGNAAAAATGASSASAGLFSATTAGARAKKEAAYIEDKAARAAMDGSGSDTQSQSQAFQPLLSVVEFKHLVTALPADARLSHDSLFKAVTAYVTAVGTGLADWEVVTLVGLVTPSRLSPSAMDAAAACTLLPLPFLVAVLRIQKQEARALFQQQQRQVAAEEAETQRAEAAVGELRGRVQAMRGRKREVQRELQVVKAALLEDHRALQTELAEAEARKAALERQLRSAAAVAAQ
ncbi:hypothetical protein CLOM_g11432 [Closterium sp. NIES-68]|nr:hypothetical protein CLOM_g11432 [Closterium sp. NIES-68]GJP72944.1 hypothetical protein CLOP_g3712 [Closterium sp. NIES-67]